MNINEKAINACATYLTHKGYEVEDTSWESPYGTADIVAWDGCDLVFVEVAVTDDLPFPEEKTGTVERQRRELIALRYLAEHEDLDAAIRFDTILVVTVSDTKAFIRHHINALSRAA